MSVRLCDLYVLGLCHVQISCSPPRCKIDDGCFDEPSTSTVHCRKQVPSGGARYRLLAAKLPVRAMRRDAQERRRYGALVRSTDHDTSRAESALCPSWFLQRRLQPWAAHQDGGFSCTRCNRSSCTSGQLRHRQIITTIMTETA